MRAFMLFAGVLFSAVSIAEGSNKQFTVLLQNKIRMVQHLALNPLIAKAVKQQNAQEYSAEGVETINGEWASLDKETQINTLSSNGTHNAVIQQFIKRNDSFDYVILTDQNGVSVSAFPLPDKYWYGDQQSWVHCFNQGSGQIYISPVQIDKKTKKYTTLVSAPVYDRSKTIGVLTVGVSLE